MRKKDGVSTGAEEPKRIEEYPVGTRLQMNGGASDSTWKVIEHVLDEDGDVVKVRLAREGKSLNNMGAEIPAGSQGFRQIPDSPQDDIPTLDDDEEDVEEAPEPTPEPAEASSPAEPKDATKDATKAEKPQKPKKTQKTQKPEPVKAEPARDGRKKFLTTSQIVERTGLTPKEVLSAISDKKLPAEKEGRTYVAAAPDVDAWAKAKRAEDRERARAKKVAEKAAEKAKADTKPASVKKAKASTEITGKKDESTIDFSKRGKHIKTPISEVQLGRFKVNDRNPFTPGSRLYGFFMAFVKGNGEATYGDFIKCYMEMQTELGMNVDGDNEWQVERDLANHVSAWQTDKEGSRGLHLRVERVDGTGRISKGEKNKARYRLVGFKDSSPYAEKARAMGW